MWVLSQSKRFLVKVNSLYVEEFFYRDDIPTYHLVGLDFNGNEIVLGKYKTCEKCVSVLLKVCENINLGYEDVVFFIPIDEVI